jgi:hypothetical protein
VLGFTPTLGQSGVATETTRLQKKGLGRKRTTMNLGTRIGRGYSNNRRKGI